MPFNKELFFWMGIWPDKKFEIGKPLIISNYMKNGVFRCPNLYKKFEIVLQNICRKKKFWSISSQINFHKKNPTARQFEAAYKCFLVHTEDAGPEYGVRTS